MKDARKSVCNHAVHQNNAMKAHPISAWAIWCPTQSNIRLRCFVTHRGRTPISI